MSDLEDDLYGLPLEEFVAARDKRAAEVREAGDEKGAAAIKKLRKPSVAAWAVNQVARQHGGALRRLVELRDEIDGASNAADMRRASDERRRTIAELLDRAEDVLTQAGRSTSGSTMQSITRTLHAGDTPEERSALVRGRLTHELTPTGFAGFSLGRDAPEKAADDERTEEKRRRAEDLADEARLAEEEAQRAEAEVAATERTLQRVRSQAEAARRAAEQARARADRARAALKDERA